MKKNIFILLLSLLIFSACEKDDICLLPTTPKLVLRLYDAANPATLKNAERLSIWADGKDTISNYISVSLDSIAIPLNVNATQTIYHFKMNKIDGNTANDITDTFTINYTTTEEYVSRSCGFKTIFNNVTITSTNGWIQSFTPTSLTIIDTQTSAHVQIFH
ncbi:DUF6452 family protein [Polaribacter uvawellassae]|uniref:DUF6452 family protein n=1 Tax=Polaribacter uvawellassae TaxID=3133495 RepID=UPI0032192E59